jgi:hypothetical protein
MSHCCFDDDELAVICSLPPDDPRRGEACACPRCDSLLTAMSAFLAEDEGLPAAERRRADRRLSAFISERLVAHAGPGRAGRPALAGGRTGESRRSRTMPRWRLGAGLAAAAAAVLLIITQMPPGPTDPSGTLRGGSSPAGAAIVGEVVVSAAKDGPPGSLRLSWPPVPEADRYLVLVFTATLDTIGIIGPVAEPTAMVESGLLGQVGADGAFCRIQALSGGLAIGASRLQRLPLP